MRLINRTSLKAAAKVLLTGAAALLCMTNSEAQSFTTVISNRLFQATGVAVSPLNHYIISDTANHRIIDFNPDTFAFLVLAGSGEPGAVDGQGADASFRTPQGLVALSDGVIVADTGNNLIRRITYQGLVQTVAGDIALAHEADDIRGLPQNAGYVDGPALTARFRGPASVALGEQNRILIADTGNKAIRVLDLAASTVSTLVSNGLHTPTAVTAGRAGDVFIADTGTHSIKRWRQGQGLTLLAGKNSPFDSGLRDSAVATNALFRSPRGIFYRETRDELIVVDSGNGLLRVIIGASTDNPRVETFANTGAAGFVTPVAVTRDAAGLFLVLDAARSSLHSVITVQSPRVADPVIGFIKIVTDPDTGEDFAIVEPVTDGTFENDVIVAVSGEASAIHHYTEGTPPLNPFEPDTIPLPTEQSPTAPNFPSPSPPSPLPNSLISPRPAVRVKAYSTGREGEERIPSRVVTSTFRFQVATPELDSKSTPGAIVFKSATTNALIWYTVDGSDPVNNTNTNPRVLGPVSTGDSIPLVVGTNLLTIKARAYRDNYRESPIAIAEFSPTNFIPNRISLGFQHGEASSDFIGSAGQRFYAPVTLSLIPGARAYGLQFNLSVDPATGPTTNDFGLAFQTMLFRPSLIADVYVPIRPSMFLRIDEEVEFFTITNDVTGQIFTDSFTNFNPVFQDLLFTNIPGRLMGVGWIERRPATNLYDTRLHDLITYSFAHNTLYRSSGGKVVPGGFSFVVPRDAQAGNTYTVRVDRPSATADGIAADIFIQAPAADDALSPVKAVRTLVIGNRTYIPGDLVPFRWYNAGDFGDTNILNNDVTQIAQAIAYGFGYPPAGSDFYDAMDTCCVTTNFVDVSTNFNAFDGSDAIINQIGFGDSSREFTGKELDVADVFIAFRRGLDPSLNWYARYWSNGVRHAVVVPNVFRGAASLRRQSVVAHPPERDPVIQTTESPGLKLSIGSAVGVPGQTVILPVVADISGGYPLRALAFSAVLETIEGEALPGKLQFNSAELGHATLLFNDQAGRVGGTWLNTDTDGVLGRKRVVGSVIFQIPENASARSIFRARLERVSGSPNGVSLFPVTVAGGIVSMENRPASAWNDGIPDSWRARHFNSTADPRSHATLDPDNDGLPNRSEFKLGTNPTDSSDNLRVRATASARNLRLRFQTVEERKYVLEASATLLPGSWQIVRPEIQGTGSTFDVDEPSNGARLYYRLRLKE
jgi:hypothetical protein